MTTLEQYFTPKVPKEFEDTILDPITRVIMENPIFSNGCIYDKSTLEVHGWKDPQSGQEVNPNIIDENAIKSVEKTIDKFLDKHASIFIQEEIENKLASKNRDSAVSNIVKLFGLLKNRKGKREVYEVTAQKLLKIIHSNMTLVSKAIQKFSVTEKDIFVDSVLNYCNKDETKISKRDFNIFTLMKQSRNLFLNFPPEILVQHFDILSKGSTNFHIITRIVKLLGINPLKYLKITSEERFNILKELAKFPDLNLTNEESDLLIQFDESIHIPCDPLNTKLAILRAHFLELELQAEIAKNNELQNRIQQLKYLTYINSVITAPNTLRIISRAHPNRCLVASPETLNCNLIVEDSEAKFQEWSLTPVNSNNSTQYYLITSKHYSKCIDNDQGLNVAGNSILVYRPLENANQHWQIIPTSDGYVCIRNATTHGYLSTASGEKVTLQFQDPDQDFHEQFQIVPFSKKN